MQIKPTTEIEPAVENTSQPELPAEAAAKPELDLLISSADKIWDSSTEQEWSEHSATAWALAHVIHRICSTPLPPILTPEQRSHFHKVVQVAAALMEEWQRRERDQAQQLVARRPIPEPEVEEPGEDHEWHDKQQTVELAPITVPNSEEQE